jgi:phospholipase/carboxylesterase
MLGAMELLYTAHVPAGEGPFPTVLALHGWGANAHDLLGLAPYLHGGEALVLCPQGPVAMEIGPGMQGYGWFPISLGGPPDPAEFAAGKAALHRFLEAALEVHPVDPRRLVLLGFSQGGVMAYDLALREPERFAGLAALSSWLPAPLADAIPRLEAHAGLPAFVTHGSKDPMIPVDRGHESRDALLRLGVPTVYREYEMGHEITAEALRALVEWLDERVLRPVQLA